MSKENKVKRAEEFISENKEILKQIKRLCVRYNHNQECAVNLYDKAQVDSIHRQVGYESHYDGNITYKFY